MSLIRQPVYAGTRLKKGFLFSKPLVFLVRSGMFMLLLCLGASGDVTPVVIEIPEATAWTGQRLPFFVELRTRGSFGGATSFDLPQVPGSVIIAAGRPTVDSKELEGTTWFVQRHEFALFSQRSGTLTLPTFAVRYGTREEYSGPVTEHKAQVPAANFEIKRPPGSEDVAFLITAESIKITERWDPQPGTAQVGDVFKRTLIQSADQMTGMALAAVPTDATFGVRIYPGQPEVNDDTERGNFVGERRETIRYLIEQPGSVTLPELRFVWWNPKNQQLEEKVFPAVTFEVAPADIQVEVGPGALLDGVWPWLWVTLCGGGLIVGFRRHMALWARRCWTRLNPPDQIAARQLLRACRGDHAVQAEAAWRLWVSTQPSDFKPDPALRSAVLDLQRLRFGPTPGGVWRGQAFTEAFRAYLADTKKRPASKSASALPALNPGNEI